MGRSVVCDLFDVGLLSRLLCGGHPRRASRNKGGRGRGVSGAKASLVICGFNPEFEKHSASQQFRLAAERRNVYRRRLLQNSAQFASHRDTTESINIVCLRHSLTTRVFTTTVQPLCRSALMVQQRGWSPPAQRFFNYRCSGQDSEFFKGPANNLYANR